MAKENLHPKYYPEAKVTCACGNTFTTGSTRPELKIKKKRRLGGFDLG
ncbi:MAG TPA: hypothetical protein ENI09_01180 [candidate division WWE3 bacterium]|uniref:50S ribosomal protein L31 n=1 Tax=candidate division WWE3 bacterium TaxID=2053526 RepID=A0A7C1NQH4_UNCKA|nr:hypothetical protein [candidate division WWE3 bacterium]